ncbi:MAG: hypothetical protein JJ891_16215 [Rhizobiaceae bacterium]|jgi:hypothetical protein|nr:hypothetical protein [Rhizobiaceae bacterium]
MVHIPIEIIPDEETIERFKREEEHFTELVELLSPFWRNRLNGRQLSQKEIWDLINHLLLILMKGEFNNRDIYVRVSYVYAKSVRKPQRGSLKIDERLRNSHRRLIESLGSYSQAGFNRSQVRKISRMTLPHVVEFVNRYDADSEKR